MSPCVHGMWACAMCTYATCLSDKHARARKKNRLDEHLASVPPQLLQPSERQVHAFLTHAWVHLGRRASHLRVGSLVLVAAAAALAAAATASKLSYWSAAAAAAAAELVARAEVGDW